MRARGRAGQISSALLPTATVEQTCRIGRYTVVAIEQVVDPHLHHLNAAVALVESVAGKERGPGRNGKCPIVEPKIIILDLRRPIGQEGPLDARTHQPAAVGVVVGGTVPTGFAAVTTSTLFFAVPSGALMGLVVSSVTAIACTRSIGQIFIEHFESGATLHDLSIEES